MTDHKKPGWTFWATAVVVVALIGYPLSFGPACWAYTYSPSLDLWNAADRLYYPLLWAWEHGARPVANGLGWYANLGAQFEIIAIEMPDGSFVVLHPGDPSK